jgi:hypothetical protein
MNLRKFACSFMLVAMVLFGASNVLSQEAKKQDPAAMMDEYQKLSLPGPEHKLLEERVGKWDHTTKMWFGPQEPPTESKGTTEYRLIMGGRFLVQEVSGEFMGKQFNGVGLLGYDKIKKQYTSAWVDNFGTAIFSSLGTPDASGRIVTYFGEMDEPVTGEKGKKVKSIERLIDKDKHVFEMYDNIPGVGEVKVLEITYIRKK